MQANDCFDEASSVDPLQPLMQRGILLYCSERYEEASKQLAKDIFILEKARIFKASDLRLWYSASCNKLGLPEEAKKALGGASLSLHLNGNNTAI